MKLRKQNRVKDNLYHADGVCFGIIRKAYPQFDVFNDPPWRHIAVMAYNEIIPIRQAIYSTRLDYRI